MSDRSYRTRSVSYQRNGIGGVGFYTVRFSARDDDEGDQATFIAVVPSIVHNEGRHAGYHDWEDMESHVCVNDLHSLFVDDPAYHKKWRGSDVWGPQVIKAIKNFERKQAQKWRNT